MPRPGRSRLRPDHWAALALGAAAVLLLLWGSPDRAIADLVRHLDPRPMAVMGEAAQLGNSSWSLIPSGALLVLLLVLRTRLSRPSLRRSCDWAIGMLAFVLVAVALSGLTVDLVKWLVGRTRPNLVARGVAYGFDPLRLDAGYQSFPSGHANTLVVLGLVLAFVVPRLTVPLLAVSAVLALGRVAASAHYLSDLIGGAAVAVATTYWLRGRFAARGWVFAPLDGRIWVNRRGRALGRWLARRARRRRGRAAKTVIAPS